MLNKPERLSWPDNSRGVAIFLVVLGHAAIPEICKEAIYSFHMHLFFFLSGLFFSTKISFWEQLVKKFHSLMLPYLFYGLLSYCVFLVSAIFIKKVHLDPDLSTFILKTFTLGDFWFLPVLFLVFLLFSLFHSFVNKVTYPFFAFTLAVVLFVTQDFSLHPKVGLLIHALSAMIFFSFGYIYKDLKIHNFPYCGLLSLIIFCIIFSLFHSYFGLQTIVKIHNHLYAYSLAFSGIISIVWISSHIPKSSILAFLGTNSLLIYLLHGYPGFLYNKLFFAVGITQSSAPLFVYGLMQSCANILLLVPIIFFINKFMPWTIGKQQFSFRALSNAYNSRFA